jgi:aspartate-semialdehyde dehydrogenase
MATGLAVGVVGATGAAGQTTLRILEERKFPIRELRCFASERSVGKTVTFRGDAITLRRVEPAAFQGLELVFCSAGAVQAREFVPMIRRAGAIVIDKSSAFRLDPGVPLVVPEINASAARQRPKGIIANPNCTTLSMIVAVGALHHTYSLESLVVASYQAASGAGQIGIDTLYDQVAKVGGHREIGTRAGDVRRIVGDDLGPFPAPLAYNVVPWAGSLASDGWTSEEMKVRNESRKILGLPSLAVSATCVRVPVVTTHSLAVHARFARPVELERVRQILREAPGLLLYDEPERLEFPTPADVVGTDPTWVGRLRVALDDPQALDLFLCGDNLRKGAALNTSQIAELVAEELDASAS